MSRLKKNLISIAWARPIPFVLVVVILFHLFFIFLFFIFCLTLFRNGYHHIQVLVKGISPPPLCWTCFNTWPHKLWVKSQVCKKKNRILQLSPKYYSTFFPVFQELPVYFIFLVPHTQVDFSLLRPPPSSPHLLLANKKC